VNEANIKPEEELLSSRTSTEKTATQFVVADLSIALPGKTGQFDGNA
jgi:hypothetical protein